MVGSSKSLKVKDNELPSTEKRCVTLNLAIKEAINALWKRAIMGGLEEGYANEVARFFLDSSVVRVEGQDQLLEEALSVAIRRKITIYDSIFIALAKRKGLSLLTSDRRQAEAAIEEGVKVVLA
jgi:predicted nucleic acid-binding protein